MDMRGWPGVDVCTFAQGLTLSYHSVVWQGEQCLIFHIVLPLTEHDADTPGMARHSSPRYSCDGSMFQSVP